MDEDRVEPTECHDPTEDPAWGQTRLPDRSIPVLAAPFPLGLAHAENCPCAGCRERRAEERG